MNFNAFWITVVAAFLSCFYTAVNYALLDFSRSRLSQLLEQRGKGEHFEHLAEYREALLMMTALLRATLNLIILLAMIAWLAPPQASSQWTQLLAAIVISAGIIAVFGVAIPLSWSRHASEPLLVFSLPVLRLHYLVLKYPMLALHGFDPLVRRLLGVPKPDGNGATEAEQEILDAVSEGEKTGLVDEEQKEMIEAVVEFPTTTVEQIMTPRTAIEGIVADASLDQIKRFIRTAGHSRVPVYENDLDHIVGILYVKDLVHLLGTPTDKPFDLKKMVREAVFVPESKTLRDLLGQFKASKVHLAMVLDEYGGTAGLVTIEDVIEEIVGEIHDEHEPPDEEEPTIEQVDHTNYDIDGRVRIDEANDELKLELPEDEDYDTIGGFVFATLGRIPETGEQFDHENFQIKVTDAEKTRVNKVRLTFVDRDAEPSETADTSER